MSSVETGSTDHSPQASPVTTVGVSLKMYFSHDRTVQYCQALAELASAAPSIASGQTQLVVMPSFPSIPAALQTVHDTAVQVGAQNLAADDFGAFTGEVSGAVLAELGVQHVEVGHAERRRLFGETDEVVTAKTVAALRNRLVPWLCVGESEQTDPAAAASDVVAQVRSAVAQAPAGRVVIAYEPHWAIGAPQPAPTEYVIEVCSAAREQLEGQLADFDIVYGGSAGPGLLTALGDSVDGIFLGRFAHDPRAVADIITEAAERTGV